MQATNQTLTATLNPAAIAADIVAKRATVAQPAKPAARKTSDNPKAKNAGAGAMAALVKQTQSSTMVTCGGTDAEPTKIDASGFPSVTFAELTNSGSVLQSLAYNFLAGTVDKSVTAEALANLPRALRNEKGAITKLLGKKSADIRAAWEKAMETRKRKDVPTLRTLAALVAGKGAKNAGAGKRVAVAEIEKILNGKQSQAMKLQMIRELCADDKAE